MKYIICFLSLLISLSVRGQNKFEVKEKTFIYEAFFINSKGDTLTNEIIEISFTDTPWKFQPKTQKNVVITYYTDTTGIKSFVYPFEKVRKKHQKFQANKESGEKGWEKWTWLAKREVTGYSLNDSVFWTHPPRDNQYIYMQLSGMPEILLDRLKIGGNWIKQLFILTGFHDWKGNVISKSEVTGTTSYNHKKISVKNAWKISIKHEHSKLGNYNSEMIFDEKEYGFLILDNKYPEGNRIVMNLIKMKKSTITDY